MIRRYRVKPKEVDICQVDRDNPDEFCEFVGDPDAWNVDEELGSVVIFFDAGISLVEHGDFIVKHGDGRFEFLLESEIYDDYEVV